MNQNQFSYEAIGPGVDFAAALMMHEAMMLRKGFGARFTFECFSPDGKLRWIDGTDNIVVNTGLDDVLDKYLKGSAYSAGFFVGLKDTTAAVAGDTMGTKGFTELTPYSNATRPALTLGTVSGQSVDNSASKASFTINATATVGGAFVTTNSTKAGTTGILFGAADFASSRSVQSGDTLNVTVTITAASG